MGEIEKIEVKIPSDGYDGKALTNLVNMIRSWQYLLAKAMGSEVLSASDNLVEELEGAKPETKADFMESLKSCGKDALKGVKITAKEITFTFPSDNQIRPIDYTELASAMCREAKERRSIQPKPHEPENEKYAMRTWLVRIGFGPENPEPRTAFLRRLKGNCAFKTEEQLRAATIKVREARHENAK